MAICILIGTRPEMIKMAPLIRACEKRKQDFFILHTGQHYSYEMDKHIFEDLNLPQPKYNLNVGSLAYRKQVGMMIRDIMVVLKQEKPQVVFVQGDTNSVLAGALAANKLGIKVGHHEAGLRSHDLTMLEETNRIITDHVSDYLFAPTADALKNLEEEGISPYQVFLTGNTVVDAVQQNIIIAEKKSKILENLGIRKKNYFLVTAHRAENVDSEIKLRGIVEGLEKVYSTFRLPVIYPVHPRTINNMAKFNIKSGNIRLIDPVGYLDFLILEANARLIITDSGGIQEEACILKVPCVTIRENTERPETIKLGINVLAGTNPEKIAECTSSMMGNSFTWENPFGDGTAGITILDIYLKNEHPNIVDN